MKAYFLIPCLLLVSCDTTPHHREVEDKSSYEPKTVYGQSVQRARNLREPSEQDKNVAGQAKQLFDGE